jgi:hypothetical protein
MYSSTNNICVFKSGRSGLIEYMGRVQAYKRSWWGNLRESGHFGNPVEDSRIITKLIFMNWEEVVWTGLMWLRIGTGVGHL